MLVMLIRLPNLSLAHLLQAASLPFLALSECVQLRITAQQENRAPIGRETGFSFTCAIEAYEEIIDTVCASAQTRGEP